MTDPTPNQREKARVICENAYWYGETSGDYEHRETPCPLLDELAEMIAELEHLRALSAEFIHQESGGEPLPSPHDER